MNSAFKETKDMVEFYPSKGYTWKTAPETTAAKKTSTAKGVLRAQETQAFRHWMDRAIETSSIKVMQARQAIDTPEEDALKPGLESPAQNRGIFQQKKNMVLYCFYLIFFNIIEDVGGKRPRKKLDESSNSNRKKKMTK